jgi:hypothetical protein
MPKTENYILFLAIGTATVDWEKMLTKIRHLLIIFVLNYINARRIK